MIQTAGVGVRVEIRHVRRVIDVRRDQLVDMANVVVERKQQEEREYHEEHSGDSVPTGGGSEIM